mmetsp:Transcript_71000/g.148006  ORF Transcript_71000/g.148006 Transcript_71000/m.148006 type:complete len:245 (-) Transcript_71000:2276-3010(-)
MWRAHCRPCLSRSFEIAVGRFLPSLHAPTVSLAVLTMKERLRRSMSPMSDCDNNNPAWALKAGGEASARRAKERSSSVSVWWHATVDTVSASEGRHPAYVGSTLFTHSAPACAPCPTAEDILQSMQPVTTKMRSPQIWRRVWVAWRVGKVWPEWEMAITMVFLSDIVVEQKLKPVMASAPWKFENTPTILLAERGTTRSLGKRFCRSDANCSPIHSDASTAMTRTSISSLPQSLASTASTFCAS